MIKNKEALRCFLFSLRHSSSSGHHMPGEDAGDAVVIFRVQEHPLFTRRGVHLFIEKNISLAEALCGVEIPVKTLDGRWKMVGDCVLFLTAEYLLINYVAVVPLCVRDGLTII